MKYEEICLSKDEVHERLKDPSWKIIGEDTAGFVHWNEETGEIISAGGDPTMFRLKSKS